MTLTFALPRAEMSPLRFPPTARGHPEAHHTRTHAHGYACIRTHTHDHARRHAITHAHSLADLTDTNKRHYFGPRPPPSRSLPAIRAPTMANCSSAAAFPDGSSHKVRAVTSAKRLTPHTRKAPATCAQDAYLAWPGCKELQLHRASYSSFFVFGRARLPVVPSQSEADAVRWPPPTPRDALGALGSV